CARSTRQLYAMDYW
nr:immunoglobulin heavy chain junction region [Mus musculus]MBK4195973.1 immunoglobulin heavy chain junction region [Mus musculus]